MSDSNEKSDPTPPVIQDENSAAETEEQVIETAKHADEPRGVDVVEEAIPEAKFFQDEKG